MSPAIRDAHGSVDVAKLKALASSKSSSQWQKLKPNMEYFPYLIEIQSLRALHLAGSGSAIACVEQMSDLKYRARQVLAARQELGVQAEQDRDSDGASVPVYTPEITSDDKNVAIGTRRNLGGKSKQNQMASAVVALGNNLSEFMKNASAAVVPSAANPACGT